MPVAPIWVTPLRSRWSSTTRRSQIACAIASAKWAKPPANSSAPLNGERPLWRPPWKGIVNNRMSQPSLKNELSANSVALTDACEALIP